MQASDRILNSKDYLDGDEFTAARMFTHCKGITKGGLGSALTVLVDSGQLNVRRGKRRGGWRNYYKRPPAVFNILRVPWVSEPSPTEYTPDYR